MPKCKVLSGLTAETTQNLVLDAGAFFKNFDFKSDTFDSAVKAGKLIGATKGGGKFVAVPKFRSVEIDGMRGAVKGSKLLESWDIKLGAKVVEVKADTIKDGLGIATVATSEVVGKTDYKVVKGKTCVKDEDYISNITWVGNLSGAAEPVVIQIFNALNTKGIEFSFEDKGELVVEMEFEGHFDMNATSDVPFVIYFPKLGVGA